MPARRILSLWFPRMGAERLLRQARGTILGPFAVVRESGNMQVLASLSAEASAAGLTRGQPLRDARAMCPELVSRLQSAPAEAEFLTALRRWAGKFSPWIAEEPPASLVIDLTGCAHLFGGEAALLDQIEADCADLGLTVQAGIADTVGAAWALARYAGRSAQAARSGDAIDQEAYATRSRAAKRRHWERGGAAPAPESAQRTGAHRIAQPGQTRSALGPLPIAALRLPGEVVTQLTRLGLRRIDELSGQPRAALSRRFGKELVLRLDQAMGVVPEPVSPAKPPDVFAVRLSLPDPIGLEEDIVAGLDRLLPALEERLTARGRGARRLRFDLLRCDHSRQRVEIGLARPASSPDRLKPLLLMKLPEIDAGPGIDVLRLEAHVTEPVHDRQHRGHLGAARDAMDRVAPSAAMDDLVGRLGARIGLEQIQRMHMAESHIPEKQTQVQAVAWSEPDGRWPVRANPPRPLVIFRPEPVTELAEPTPGEAHRRPPGRLRWRRQTLEIVGAAGPERIAPEWWLDDPDWRSGQRDYWRVETSGGERLWLYYAHGGEMSAGWFCQGRFA